MKKSNTKQSNKGVTNVISNSNSVSVCSCSTQLRAKYTDNQLREFYQSLYKTVKTKQNVVKNCKGFNHD